MKTIIFSLALFACGCAHEGQAEWRQDHFRWRMVGEERELIPPYALVPSSEYETLKAKDLQSRAPASLDNMLRRDQGWR